MDKVQRLLKIEGDEKTAIFIDGNNLYNACKTIQDETGQEYKFDFIRLTNFFEQNSQYRQANYYTAMPVDKTNNPVVKLIDFLDYNGFNIVAKDANQSKDIFASTDDKGPYALSRINLSVDLICDVYDILDHVDHIVIFSGDGQLARLCHSVRKKAKRITIVSTTHGKVVSDNLIRSCSNFVEMSDPYIRNQFSKLGTYDLPEQEEAKKPHK